MPYQQNSLNASIFLNALLVVYFLQLSLLFTTCELLGQQIKDYYPFYYISFPLYFITLPSLFEHFIGGSEVINVLVLTGRHTIS